MAQEAGVLGFEPRDDGVKVRCLTAWLYPYKWTVRGSNPRPSACKADALPAELTVHIIVGNTYTKRVCNELDVLNPLKLLQ